MLFNNVLNQYQREQPSEEKDRESINERANRAFDYSLEQSRPILSGVIGAAFQSLEKMGRQPIVEYDQDVADVVRQHSALLHKGLRAWFTLSFFPQGGPVGVTLVRFPIHFIPVYRTQNLHIFGRIARLGGKAEYHHYGSFDGQRLCSGPSGIEFPARRMVETAIQDMRVLHA
ncbi:hypothetical protein [Polyangium sorediatum]|uniref:Uncharacterized protein n=1 Tax=Polyangium sorediatum TaxID=889274 RepID=A0ABT6NQ86_9BACT|nr:hypothetical protein [Polyangium sorediatum]MDI1430441.1 hypothetical protein [Polyangium sorediatum]